MKIWVRKSCVAPAALQAECVRLSAQFGDLLAESSMRRHRLCRLAKEKGIGMRCPVPWGSPSLAWNHPEVPLRLPMRNEHVKSPAKMKPSLKATRLHIVLKGAFAAAKSGSSNSNCSAGTGGLNR